MMTDENSVEDALLVSEVSGFEKGRVAGMLDAAKIVEERLIYGNRENPEWAQRIIAGEIRRRASELG